MSDVPWSRSEFATLLREQGSHYHIHHPFNVSVPRPTGWPRSLAVGMRLVHEAPEKRELGA